MQEENPCDPIIDSLIEMTIKSRIEKLNEVLFLRQQKYPSRYHEDDLLSFEEWMEKRSYRKKEKEDARRK